MTHQEAEEKAARLGMSAWITRAVAVGRNSEVVDLMCVGFASIDFPVAEGESWEEALDKAARIIFAA